MSRLHGNDDQRTRNRFNKVRKCENMGKFEGKLNEGLKTLSDGKGGIWEI